MNYWLLFILADILGNFYLIEVKKKKPVYLQLFILRGMAAIAHGIIYDLITGEFQNAWMLSGWDLLKLYAPFIGFQIASHLLLFSPALNFLRHKEKWFTYRGKDSGWLDGIANGDYPWVYWTLYGIAFIYFSLTIIGL
jgi:hypothetical protein